jgi:hypothetical protein
MSEGQGTSLLRHAAQHLLFLKRVVACVALADTKTATRRLEGISCASQIVCSLSTHLLQPVWFLGYRVVLCSVELFGVLQGHYVIYRTVWWATGLFVFCGTVWCSAGPLCELQGRLVGYRVVLWSVGLFGVLQGRYVSYRTVWWATGLFDVLQGCLVVCRAVCELQERLVE